VYHQYRTVFQTSISANADGLCDAASCKNDRIVLCSDYNYQAMSIGR